MTHSTEHHHRSWFVQLQVARGNWREEVIAPELSGLTRPLPVFRAPRKSEMIAYDWHGDKQTFCPPIWWDLAVGSGACGYQCRSCFLMLTFRVMRDPSRHLLYDNLDDFIHAAERWLKDSARRRQHTLCVGIDRSDSFLYEGVTGHVRRLAPLFANAERNPCGNKLILLTKSANTHYLADIMQHHRRNVVVTFSLNPEPIADLWEGKYPNTGERITPSIARRLDALEYAQALGHEVRVRLDPILTPEGWKEHYAAFLAEVKRRGINFHYWTLGPYVCYVEFGKFLT